MVGAGLLEYIINEMDDGGLSYDVALKKAKEVMCKRRVRQGKKIRLWHEKQKREFEEWQRKRKELGF